MSGLVIEAGDKKLISATGDVFTNNGLLMGFYVNSTSSGTLVLREGGSGGTAISGTITPSIGYNAFPCSVNGGLHATVGGTINVTFFYQPT